MRKQEIRIGTIDLGKPWLYGSNVILNGTLRKECLDADVFSSLMEAQVVIEQWQKKYNELTPHSSQHYVTPVMAYFGLRSRAEKLTV